MIRGFLMILPLTYDLLYHKLCYRDYQGCFMINVLILKTNFNFPYVYELLPLYSVLLFFYFLKVVSFRKKKVRENSIQVFQISRMPLYCDYSLFLYYSLPHYRIIFFLKWGQNIALDVKIEVSGF